MLRCALLLGLLLVLSACTREPDEQALRRTMAGMEAAVESGRAADFLAHVSEDFSGQDGSVDRRQLRALLVGYQLRYQDIGLVLGPATVKLFGDRATVTVDVLASSGRGLPETGRVFAIESHWRRDGGEWRCFSANWSG